MSYEAQAPDFSEEIDPQKKAEQQIAGAFIAAQAAREAGESLRVVTNLSMVEELPGDFTQEMRDEAIAYSSTFYQEYMDPDTIRIKNKKLLGLNTHRVTGRHFADQDITISYTTTRPEGSMYDLTFSGKLSVNVRKPLKLPFLRLVR